MSDLIIVKVKDGINIDADMMRHLRNEIIKQKETGVILLPWFLTAIAVPKDTEIKIESEEQDPCDTCGYEEGSIYCKEHCPHEAKIEREPKTEKWIPVKESLPKTAREVRVTDGTDVFIGWYDGTEWCSSSELFWPDTDPITAWMPYHIPKPYKKESEDKV